MRTQVKLNAYTPKEISERWGSRAWKNTPAVTIAFPFPGGVLFGAEERGSGKSVSFFLDPDDAMILGQMLIDAAKRGRK